MSYTLFGSETSFTEVLFGKSEQELIKERESFSNGSSSSDTSSSVFSTDSTPSNALIQDHLDALLEASDSRVGRIPVEIPEIDGQSPPLCTRMPPPGFCNLLPPSLLAQMDEMVEENMEILPPSFFWSSGDVSSGYPHLIQFPVPPPELPSIPPPLSASPVFPNQFAMPFSNMMPLLTPPLQIPLGFPVPFELPHPSTEAQFKVPPPLDLMSIPPISFWPVREERLF